MASTDTDTDTDTDRPTGQHHERGQRGLGVLLREFPWIHLTLGLIGNTSFFVGSIFFFYEGLKTAGIWLFVIGSLGMLLGSIGEFVIRIEKKRRDDL